MNCSMKSKLAPRSAVHLDDLAVLDLDARRGIVGAAHGDHADLGPLLYETVLVDGPSVRGPRIVFVVVPFWLRLLTWPVGHGTLLQRENGLLGRRSLANGRAGLAVIRCTVRPADLGVSPRVPSSLIPDVAGGHHRLADCAGITAEEADDFVGVGSAPTVGPDNADALDIGRLERRIDHQHADDRGSADASGRRPGRRVR